MRLADVILIPIIPSVFDEGTTARFLSQLKEIKPVRKGKRPYALVRNRLRSRSRSVARLERFIGSLQCEAVGRIPDRAVLPKLPRRAVASSTFPESGAKPCARTGSTSSILSSSRSDRRRPLRRRFALSTASGGPAAARTRLLVEPAEVAQHLLDNRRRLTERGRLATHHVDFAAALQTEFVHRRDDALIVEIDGNHLSFDAFGSEKGDRPFPVRDVVPGILVEHRHVGRCPEGGDHIGTGADPGLNAGEIYGVDGVAVGTELALAGGQGHGQNQRQPGDGATAAGGDSFALAGCGRLP